MRYTCPAALMEPRICEGAPVGSLILLKATHVPTSVPPALWSKVSVVFLPILKVCQLSSACWLVCLMLTEVFPLSVDWTGVFAPDQVATVLANPLATSPLSGTSPPLASPSGILGSC